MNERSECKGQLLRGLILGYPLDHLLDQTIEINKPYDRRPGIRLPCGDYPGTGNIVICGPPGSGKSTLGLQIAVACAKTEENGAVSAYISLESTIAETKAKAKDYGWLERTWQADGANSGWLLEAGQLSDADEFFTPKEHAEDLGAMLTSRPDDPNAAPNAGAAASGASSAPSAPRPTLIPPTVLLSALTPRDILGGAQEGEEVFWRRYRQIECLLMAARELEELREKVPAAVLSLLAQAVIALARHLVIEAKLGAAKPKDEGDRDPQADLAETVEYWIDKVSVALGFGPAPAADSSGQAESEAVQDLASLAQQIVSLMEKDWGKPPTTLDLRDLLPQIEARVARLKELSSTKRSAETPALDPPERTGESTTAEVVTGAEARGMPPASEVARENSPQVETQAEPLRASPLRDLSPTEIDGLERKVEEAAAKVVARREARAILPLVVIDSLNMFGSSQLTRNHVYQLLQLFKRYRRVGVFIVESNDGIAFDSTVADVVIRLSSAKDDGYAVRHIEIEKSRYSNCVRGIHPFKSVDFQDLHTPPFPNRNPPRRGDPREPARCGMVVFPSLHHVVLRTDSTSGQLSLEQYKSGPFGSCFGLEGFESVLPGLCRAQLISADPPYLRGKVVMIKGDRGTFKKNLGLSFLAHGLINDESVMLVRLSDVPLIELPNELREEHELARRDEPIEHEMPVLANGLIKDFGFGWEQLRLANDSPDWQYVAPLGKVLLRKLYVCGTASGCKLETKPEEHGAKCGRESDRPALFEADFKGGHIQPEELVQFVSDVLIRRGGERGEKGSVARIRRVVFGDVAQIGVSYPFLRNSLTSGDLFLPAFVHLMRNYGVDLVMLGTMSGVAEADAAVNKAATLADAVVTCRVVDVFGTAHVVVSADQAGRLEPSTVPPVVRRSHTHFEPAKGTDNVTADNSATARTSDAGGANPGGSGTQAAASGPGTSLPATEATGTPAAIAADPPKAVEPAAGAAAPGVDAAPTGVPAAGSSDDRSPADVHSKPGPPSNEVDCFELEPRYLEGLVGLDTPNPHRPGLVLQLFEDDPPQATYNREMELMLRAALARPRGRSFPDVTRGPDAGSDGQASESEASDVFMQPFDSEQSEAIHDSLDILLGKPVNRTVLCTVDEFFGRDQKAAEGPFVQLRDSGGGLDGRDPGSVYPRPYYRNVLLVAYKQTWLNKNRPAKRGQSRIWCPQTWNEIRDATQSDKHSFWYDQKARETLACMLMDTLAAAWKQDHPGPQASPAKERPGLLADLLLNRPSLELSTPELDQLVALAHLLCAGRTYAAGVGGLRPPLHEKAAVYVCWYSQLRELIDRVPSLAGDLRVCPLPGGGFRGDWYVGILKGSVSYGLGQEVVEKLCRLDEDYKRFALGVGLPVSDKFSTGKCQYFAWPLAVGVRSRRPTVPVSEVVDIHKGAWLRSDIDGYKQIRSTLWMRARQLSQIEGMSAAGHRRLVEAIVGETMFMQLLMLTGKLG
jgi:KaiC/GvpD/RAD55 family RecA-like ATPase